MGRAAFRLGMVVTAPALILLLFLRPDTAEFSIAVLSAGVGLVFLALTALLARISASPRGRE